MNKNIWINRLLALALVFTACDNRLDIDPRNSLDAGSALQTSADVQALMVGAYDAASDIDVYGGNIQLSSELLGDAGEVFWDGTFVAPGEIWAKSMLINNDQANATWLDCYKVINICNTVLANLDLLTEDRVERIEGEAKFLTGAVYFEPVRLFGREWNDGVPGANTGVPTVTTPTTDENKDVKVPRSSVAEVYALVV